MRKMDIEYIITESRKMETEKAIRYLRYHRDIQQQKEDRLKNKIAEIKDIIARINKEIFRREQQKEIASYVSSDEMGEGEKEKEEVKERE